MTDRLARAAIRTICCRRQSESLYAPDHRTTSAPQGRPSAHHRQRLLQRRRQSARPGLRPRAALAARACPHPLDRRCGGARMPGVLAVLTGADVVADGLKEVPHTPIPMKPPADILLKNRDGSEHGYAPQQLLPTDRVRYVGKQVVMVVADTLAAAKDAAEHVIVDYEPLKPVTGTAAAASRRAAALRAHRQYLHRFRRRRRRGGQGGVRPRPHVAKLETWVQRVTGVPLDARAAVGVYDPAANKYTLHAGSGGVVRQKHELATDPRRRARRRARRMRRRRRQFRHAQRVLPGIRAGGVGGQAPRPAGEMDLRAVRGFRQRLPGPRPGDRGRACARRQGPLSGDARLDHLQHRRPHRDVRAAGEVLGAHVRSTACRRRTSAPARP